MNYVHIESRSLFTVKVHHHATNMQSLLMKIVYVDVCVVCEKHQFVFFEGSLLILANTLLICDL